MIFYKPQFLSTKDIIDLRRNTCLFCNETFNTKKIIAVKLPHRGRDVAENFLHCPSFGWRLVSSALFS